MFSSDTCVISATRDRIADEIIPDGAENSRSWNGNEDEFGAARAIDLDLDTSTRTAEGSDGKTWLKVNLSKLHCIEQIIEYYSDGPPVYTRTCTSSDCSRCEGNSYWCNRLLITTSSERTSSDDLPLIAHCIYGDTVQIGIVLDNHFGMAEIAITGKQGKIRYSRTPIYRSRVHCFP